MSVSIAIDGADNAGRAFVGWTPVKATVTLSGMPGSTRVKLRSAGTVGGVLLGLSRNDAGAADLSLDLTNNVATQIWIAGKFGAPSSDYGDAAVEAVAAATGAVLGSAKLMVRVRKNAVTLSAAERDRYLAALGRLNARGQGPYRIIRDMHTAASDDEIHGHPAFLPWHRAYLLDLERRLQAIDDRIALPYWRFDEPAPQLFTRDYMGQSDETERVTFRPGHALEHWVTDDQSGIIRGLDFPVAGPANVISEAQTLGLEGPARSYSGFRRMEGNPHGSAHVSFSETSPIAHPPTAVRDPLFFMLHANVDRLWAKWQWIRHHYEASDPKAYQNGNRVGRRLGDTLWPWNGIFGSPRPPTAPGGRFPAAVTTSAPGGTPKIDDMLDALAVKGAAPLGFCYDDVPFEPPTLALAGQP